MELRNCLKKLKIFAETISAINKHIRAAIHKVENSFWNLNALCAVDIDPSIFSTIKSRTKREEFLNEEKMKPGSRALVKHKGTAIAKRALFTAVGILVGVISTFALGGIVATAVDGQEERKRINLIGEKVEEVDGIIAVSYTHLTLPTKA